MGLPEPGPESGGPDDRRGGAPIVGDYAVILLPAETCTVTLSPCQIAACFGS
jgi:hypothetical protein